MGYYDAKQKRSPNSQYLNDEDYRDEHKDGGGKL